MIEIIHMHEWTNKLSQSFFSLASTSPPTSRPTTGVFLGNIYPSFCIVENRNSHEETLSYLNLFPPL